MNNDKQNILVVLGPPGTGKTTRLAERINAAANKFDAESIIACSFTRAAAKEIAGRDTVLPNENVGTLHSFCFRALAKPQIAESKESLATWNEAFPHMALSAGLDLDDPMNNESKSDADLLFNDYQRLRARSIDRSRWNERERGFADKWDDFKKQEDSMDFNDLIEVCIKNKVAPPRGAEIGFFDEFQDFTSLQAALVLQWTEQLEYSLFSGDDDQLIYHFAGASASTFLNLNVEEKYKERLTQSYRVPKAIHRHAVNWIKKIKRREVKEYLPTDVEGEVIRSSASYMNPEDLLRYVEESMKAERSIMILGACSYQLSGMIKTLRDEGIPFHNPYRSKRGDWNPVRHRKGSLSSLERLQRFVAPKYTDRHLWPSVADIKVWADMLPADDKILRRGAKKFLKDNKEVWFDDVDYSAHKFLLAICAGPLMAVIANRTAQEQIEFFCKNVMSSKRSAFEFPRKIMKKYDTIQDIEASVIVGTIHSVKGGEADDVIIFPDISLAGKREIEDSLDGREAAIRQFYVGMTRARERLIICSPATRFHVSI